MNHIDEMRVINEKGATVYTVRCQAADFSGDYIDYNGARKAASRHATVSRHIVEVDKVTCDLRECYVYPDGQIEEGDAS